MKEYYDEDKEFFVVDGRKCMMYRPLSWSKDKNEKVLTRTARKEIEIKYHLIVQTTNKISQVENVINLIKNQILQPSRLTLIRKPENLIKTSYIWQLKTNTDDINDDLFVDMCVLQHPVPYYCYIKCDTKLQLDTFKKIDILINDNLLQFGAIVDKDFVFVPHIIHTMLNGNKNKSLLEKIKDKKWKTIKLKKL